MCMEGVPQVGMDMGGVGGWDLRRSGDMGESNN